MSEAIKAELQAELNTLLEATEHAINSGDRHKSLQLSTELLLLIGRYEHRLSRAEIREVANNPVANAIAKRLRVLP